MARKPSSSTGSETKLPDFETSIQRLEQLIDQVESGQVPLEESIERYAQGMELVRHCRSILEKAEQKIRLLKLDEQGDLREAGEAPEAGA